MNIKPGNKFRIDSVTEPYSYLSQRMSSMGLVVGAEIEVRNIAPLGEPIEIKSRGYNLSLRRDELNRLTLAQLT